MNNLEVKEPDGKNTHSHQQDGNDHERRGFSHGHSRCLVMAVPPAPEEGRKIGFLNNPEKEVLIGITVSENQKFLKNEDLVVSLNTKNSLLTTSLLHQKPMNSFSLPADHKLAISDEQIIRFIGKEGILCFPMVVYGEPVGVIVMGADEVEFSHLVKNFNLLTMFINQAALPLHVDQIRRNHLKTIQSERLNASSAIARKVLHEVNNPLSIIKNFLKILDIKLSELNIAQDEIRIINEEIDRVALILSELTSFSEVKIHNNELVDINRLLSDMIKITKESLLKDARIRLHLDIEPSVPPVMANKNGLKQVFVNLIKNAVEAMTEGGNLNIQTRYIPNPISKNQAHHYKEQKKYIEIVISDDGVGVSDAVKAYLFQPFVSSKGSGHSGIGLSIVHNIIKSLNGTIECNDNKPKGTTFIIKLPV